MKVDIHDGIADELRALKNMARFTPGNSDTEKLALWIGMAVASIIILGTAFGLVDFEALPDAVKGIVYGFVAMLVYLFGRTHGREVTLEERRHEKQ